MKLIEIGRAIWRNVEAFAYALEYDQHAEIRSRLARLEQMAAYETGRAAVQTHPL